VEKRTILTSGLARIVAEIDMHKVGIHSIRHRRAP